MPLEPKAQLVDPQGPIDVTGVNATGVTTATGGFVGNIQGSATGLASTTLNLTAGIITATRFIGDVTGTASSLNRGANITVGIMTATFVGDLVGNATGLSTTTSNLNLGIVTSTGFRGNFTGLSSGLSGPILLLLHSFKAETKSGSISSSLILSILCFIYLLSIPLFLKD